MTNRAIGNPTFWTLFPSFDPSFLFHLSNFLVKAKSFPASQSTRSQHPSRLQPKSRCSSLTADFRRTIGVKTKSPNKQRRNPISENPSEYFRNDIVSHSFGIYHISKQHPTDNGVSSFRPPAPCFLRSPLRLGCDSALCRLTP